MSAVSPGGARASEGADAHCTLDAALARSQEAFHTIALDVVGVGRFATRAGMSMMVSLWSVDDTTSISVRPTFDGDLAMEAVLAADFGRAALGSWHPTLRHVQPSLRPH